MKPPIPASTATPAPEAEQKWPSRLVLVRHAESTHNQARGEARRLGLPAFVATAREADVPLTERGKLQALGAGVSLAREKFDWVFCSPFRRCQETAALLCGQFPQPPEILYEERVREREFGIWGNLLKPGRKAKYPDEWARYEREGKYYYRPPGGESYPDVALRIHSFLGTLTRECRGQSVLVVTHSVVIMIFRRLLERLSEAELLRIDQDPEQEVLNCSATVYRFDPAARKLKLTEFSTVPYAQDLVVPPGPRD